ncbi:MAG: type I-E CRISPR-associated protein Cas5/CasD [Anaerolineae bacterium]
MATLLMRFIAPMQAWGTQSRYGHRDTGLEPSKSGVIGILGAALGRPRDADLRDLTALRMGVRVDRQGQMRRDYHTAGKDGYMKIDGRIERRQLMVSDRYYLADAAFLVGLEGDRALLADIDAALRAPVYPIFMGRKAFPPACPVWMEPGLRDVTLDQALVTTPPLVPLNAARRLRVVIDDPLGSALRHDDPISFQERRFLPRMVSTYMVDAPAAASEE